MKEATSEVLLIKLAPTIGVFPDSKPGQYLEVALPEGERIPLSVANRPGDSTPWIELHLHHGPERRRVGLLLETLRSEGLLAVDMPRGDVWFDAPLAASLLLLASGTGIAQSKAVIEAVMASPNPSGHRLSLIWAARTNDDFYMREALQAWSFEVPEFEFTLFALQGRDVKELYAMADAERKRIGSDDILASGSGGFVSGCLSYFASVGAHDCRVHSDMPPRSREGGKRSSFAVGSEPKSAKKIPQSMMSETSHMENKS